MDQLAAAPTSVASNGRANPETALELVRQVVHLLDAVTADVRESEHHELRLSRALAASLADQLEAIVEHRMQSRGSEGRRS